MQSVRKFNYKNHPMNLPQKGLGDFLKKNSSDVGTGLGFTGTAVDALNPESKWGGDMASGALKGAGIGMMLGPWGAAAGAAIGGVVSLFTHKAQERAEERAKAEAIEAEKKRLEGVTAVNADASLSIIKNFPTTGIDRPRMNKGGKIAPGQAKYLAEAGEVIQYAPGQEPATDKFGGLNRLNSTTSLIKGATHDSKSQGVGMTGGQRIFSDDPRLKVPKGFEKLLKRI